MESLPELQTNKKAKYKIYGSVDPQFMPVLKKFESFYAEDYDQNSQLCVYHKDKCVVDIWGVTPNAKKQPFTADSPI